MNHVPPEIIKEIVAETIRELMRNGLLKRADDVAYSEISNRLFEYYQNPGRDEKMKEALERISRDYYFQIIPQFYRNKMTIDWIAEDYHCEVSTIARNKKRLCLRLYNLTS